MPRYQIAGEDKGRGESGPFEEVGKEYVTGIPGATGGEQTYLIAQATDVLAQAIKPIRKAALVQDIVFEKVTADLHTDTGEVSDGIVTFAMKLSAAWPEHRSKIWVHVPIVGGYLYEPSIFHDSAGRDHPITAEAITKHLGAGFSDSQPFRMPTVEIAYTDRTILPTLPARNFFALAGRKQADTHWPPEKGDKWRVNSPGNWNDGKLGVVTRVGMGVVMLRFRDGETGEYTQEEIVSPDDDGTFASRRTADTPERDDIPMDGKEINGKTDGHLWEATVMDRNFATSDGLRANDGVNVTRLFIYADEPSPDGSPAYFWGEPYGLQIDKVGEAFLNKVLDQISQQFPSTTASLRRTAGTANKHGLKVGDKVKFDDGYQSWSGTVKSLDDESVWFIDDADGAEYDLFHDNVFFLRTNGDIKKTSSLRRTAWEGVPQERRPPRNMTVVFSDPTGKEEDVTYAFTPARMPESAFWAAGEWTKVSGDADIEGRYLTMTADLIQQGQTSGKIGQGTGVEYRVASRRLAATEEEAAIEVHGPGQVIDDDAPTGLGSYIES